MSLKRKYIAVTPHEKLSLWASSYTQAARRIYNELGYSDFYIMLDMACPPGYNQIFAGKSASSNEWSHYKHSSNLIEGVVLQTGKRTTFAQSMMDDHLTDAEEDSAVGNIALVKRLLDLHTQLIKAGEENKPLYEDFLSAYRDVVARMI